MRRLQHGASGLDAGGMFVLPRQNLPSAAGFTLQERGVEGRIEFVWID